MPSNYSPSRRPSRPQSGRRRPSQKTSSHPSPRPKAPKVSFLGKLLSFFGLGAKKPAPRPKTAGRTSSERPQRTRVTRKPEQIEVTSPRLYVGNLSFDASESDLFELFSGIGQVQNVELVSHRDTHRSKGFGFIQMTVIEEAKRAVAELHDKEYMGRKLVVSGARALPERAERPAREAAPTEETPAEQVEACENCCDHEEKSPE